MIALVPNSFGSRLREFNPCNRPKDGKFGRKGECGPTVSGKPASQDLAAALRRGERLRAMPEAKQPPSIGSVMVGGFDVEDKVQLIRMFGRVPSRDEIRNLTHSLMQDVPDTNPKFHVQVSTVPFGAAQADLANRKPALYFRFIGDDGVAGANATILSRSVELDPETGELVAHHAAFMKGEGAQRADYGKDVLRSHVKAWQDLGVSRIETSANINVGAYAWAKYGFTARDPQAFHDDITQALRDLRIKGVVSLEESDAVKSIMSPDDPTAPWRVADATYQGKKLGKTVLIGATADEDFAWAAELRFDDQQAMDRFWGYVGKRPTRLRTDVTRPRLLGKGGKT